MAASTSPPVFVGGCPRSGTTLVRSILNAHPDLAIPHETRFVVAAYRNRRAYGDLSDPRNAQRLARWIVKRRRSRIDRLAISREEIVAAITSAPPTLGSMLGAPYAAHAAARGKPRWGDKRPHYALNLDAVEAMFPDAQYVNIVRDPRSAIASIREYGATRNWYGDGIIDGLDVWRRSQKSVDRWRGRLGPERFLEIQYERFVSDPETGVAELVAFLGLDPAGTDAMFEFHKNQDIRAPNLHRYVRKPVTTEAVRRFETSMERTEIALIERELAEQMARYGYEPVAADVTIPREFDERMKARRKAVRKRRAEAWARERYRRATYRYPVAARPDEARKDVVNA
ncbi:MAG: hypothetical protein QOI80_234 [Solirubrobacteraceae bacterium]|nr:hypothetical protein [Solirubrobacteraceae bacterium]